MPLSKSKKRPICVRSFDIHQALKSKDMIAIKITTIKILAVIKNH